MLKCRYYGVDRVLGIVDLHHCVFADRIQYLAQHPMVECISKGSWFCGARVCRSSQSNDMAGRDKNTMETGLKTNLAIPNHGSTYHRVPVPITRVIVFDESYLKWGSENVVVTT